MNAVAVPAASTTPPSLRSNRAFGLLWAGEGVSVLGNATTSVLIPVLAVTTLGAGPGWMGTLTAAAWLPWLAIGLPAGAWVDRLPPRAVMITADLVAAAVLASVPLAWFLGVLTLPHLVLAALGGGVATVFFRTAYAALLPQVVHPTQLESANGRLFGTESAMQVAGPGVGGLLAQLLSAAVGLVVDVASFLVSAVCLWRMKPTYAVARPTTPAAPLRERIAEGLHFVSRDRYLRFLVFLGGASNLGLTGYAALLVLFLVDDLGLSAGSVGTVMAIAGTGGLVGAAVATRISTRWGSGRASTWLCVLGGPPALLIPLAGSGSGVVLVVVGMVLVGVCVGAGNVIRGAWRIRYVPSELLGRSLTAMQVVNYGTMPVAGLLAGWMGSHLGVRETIAVMTGIHCAACFSMLLSPLRGLRVLPERAATTDVA